ncbi:MAG TPA: M10 family metallopeptidase C-terminal domain-containing protein [Allosphingosinicella sp.]|nr:M10 family metallopeptidase C-terminal domain-containing protein [Allosphingosinicella sp.]
MAAVTRNVRSGDQDIDGLLELYRWSSGSLTYSFPTAGSQYDGYRVGEEPFDNFEALTANQQAAVRQILLSYSAVANITFTRVSGGAGDLRFGSTDATEAAHAYTPGPHPMAGDSWYNNSFGWFNDPVRGDYGYHGFLHEIGHAVGLKHPHESHTFGRTSATYDQMQFSVMSYRSYQGQTLEGGFANEEFGFAQSLMMYDIAALQHLYGARFDVEPVDTHYSWSPDSGEMSINGVGQGEPGANRIFLTVWDGGGNDTYDFSAYTRSLDIDLRPGEWSTTLLAQRAMLNDNLYARGNIANALLYRDDQRSLIENAIGGSNRDILIGNDGDNRLEGGAGSDTIDGGLGADTMIGGPGVDRYVVDDPLDLVIEQAEGWSNAVLSSVSYALPPYVAELTLTGDAPINGMGNEFANVIHGNAAANILDGGEGADVLHSEGGDDIFYLDHIGDRIVPHTRDFDAFQIVRSTVTARLPNHFETLELLGSKPINGTGSRYPDTLIGNSAANVLDGGAREDVMAGGPGDDTYCVDNVGDQIIELAAEGEDTVLCSISFELAAEIEHLTLAGTSPLSGTGNSGANRITGNAAANLIDGREGADTMSGGAGDDVYKVDDRADRVIETSAGGSDTVLAWVSYVLRPEAEVLTLEGAGAVRGTGNAGANLIVGTAAANVIDGRAGADRLHGGAGSDRMTGGEGADGFYFETRLNRVTNVDEILDFSRVDDGIYLDRSVFAAIGEGRLVADAFHRGAFADEAADRILFDAATGNLFYDPDGNGAAAAALFARLEPGTALGAADFVGYG